MNTHSIIAHPRHRGVVMIITLLASLLLAALVMWVLNLGQQVDRRVNTQDAADATAIAGSGWVARSMNTVAQNNLTISRYIAAISVLDAMPMAVDFTDREQNSLQDALERQLGNGVGSGPTSLMNKVRDLLETMNGELLDEVAMLDPVNDLFKDIDEREMTWYNAPGGRGRMWQAMAALDEISQATLENLGDLAQLNAVTGGSLDLPADAKDSATAVLVPIHPQLPWQRGRFDDFERPVKYGLLPLAIDDRVERRGPFDTVFGWHKRHGRYIGGVWVPGTRNGPRGGGGRGNVPIGRGGGGGGGGGGHRVGGEWIWTSYSTWGWMDYYLSGGDWSDPDHGFSGTFASFRWAHLKHSRIDWWLRQIANIKLRYLWPGDLNKDGFFDENDLNEIQLQDIVDPNWIIDYNEARAIASSREGRRRIKETAFFAVEIKSKYPKTSPAFMTEGTWAPVADNERQQPRLVRVRGWQDPMRWGVPQTARYGWSDEWNYQMWWDTSIGITPIGEEGHWELQTVYRYDHYYFAGINVGPEVTVDNPYEGFDRNADDAPAPLHLVHDKVKRDPDSRLQYLSFLAAALQSDRPQTWDHAFYSGKPYNRVVALAQAKVFNNHSWDLWTPMWNAQLEPIYRYDLWMNAMHNGLAQGVSVPQLNAAEVQNLYQYLNSLETLAPVMLGH